MSPSRSAKGWTPSCAHCSAGPIWKSSAGSRCRCWPWRWEWGRPEPLRPALEALGRRHVGYGVEDHHYDLVGAALLWTLEQGLGDKYTRSVRDAWTAVYTTLSTIMQDAAAAGREAA